MLVSNSFMSARIRGLAFTALLIASAWMHEAVASDLIRSKSVTRTVYDLEFTIQLITGPDAGLVGIALVLRNGSTSQPLHLSRKSGEIPMSVAIYREKDAVPLSDGRGIALRAINHRSTVERKYEAKGRTIRWRIEPGGTEEYVLPVRDLFTRLPETPLTECTVSVVPLIWPPREYWQRRTPLRKPGQDSDALGVDAPLKDVKFKNVILTKETLQLDRSKLIDNPP